MAAASRWQWMKYSAKSVGTCGRVSLMLLACVPTLLSCDTSLTWVSWLRHRGWCKSTAEDKLLSLVTGPHCCSLLLKVVVNATNFYLSFKEFWEWGRGRLQEGSVGAARKTSGNCLEGKAWWILQLAPPSSWFIALEVNSDRKRIFQLNGCFGEGEHDFSLSF